MRLASPLRHVVGALVRTVLPALCVWIGLIWMVTAANASARALSPASLGFSLSLVLVGSIWFEVVWFLGWRQDHRDAAQEAREHSRLRHD
jgi:ABC-type transport system involved in cytochrome c biogenesis permease subunit